MRRCLGILVLTSAVAIGLSAAPASADTAACWGQASAALAQMGEMGTHASQQEEPRAGLGNLARLFFEDGIIDEPTLQALGVFLVSIDPDLTVEACMD